MAEKDEEERTHNTLGNLLKQGNELPIETTEETSEHRCDWISQLPDSLLFHIMSHMKMRDVMNTSLLSRRWRNLWKSTPCLDFTNCWGFIDNSESNTTFIDKCLFHHDGSKVPKFHISFRNMNIGRCALPSQIDSWIDFTVRCKVEEFKLDLCCVDFMNHEHRSYSHQYKLPHSLFNCESLTNLFLSGCDLNLPPSMRLSSLKTLSLRLIDLPANAINHLTSSCLVLEELRLEDCCSGNWTDLNISIENKNVKKLVIHEGSRYTPCPLITIHAPKLLVLEFSHCLPWKNWHVKNLESLLTVSFTLDGMLDECSTTKIEDVSYFYDMTKLLCSFQHVKDIRLSCWCIQALSLKELQRLHPVPINSTGLEVETGLTKWELPGIAYLLQSASNLEKLTITLCYMGKLELGKELAQQYGFEEKEYWKSRELDLAPSILLNTKIININGYSFWKYHGLGNCWEKEMEFVRFLLKNAGVLERMNVNINKKDDYITLNGLNNYSEQMFKLTEKLASFPKASPNAEVVIT